MNNSNRSSHDHAPACERAAATEARPRPRTGIKRALKFSAVGLAAGLLTGCVLLGDKLDQLRWHLYTVPFYVFDNAPNYHKPPQPAVMEEPVNFAIAISGGGSRSAVFAAGVMEQLAHLPDPSRPNRSVLDATEAVSAVSGGSLAAAYYGLYKPADFRNPEQTSAFFQRFKSNMTTDFTFRGVVHYLSHPWEAGLSYYSRYRLSQTLANTFDQYIFKGAVFEHLQEREICGESPVILLNATSLDTGQKFIFSNLNIASHFSVDAERLVPRLPRLVPESDVAPLGLLAQINSSPVFSSFGFDSIDSDIGMFRLASAVAASSAYPILPGEYALSNYCTGGYVHLGDGGLNDNFGVDALIAMYLNKLQTGRRAGKLVVLSINAGLPLEPDRVGDPDGYISAIEYGERAGAVMQTRGYAMTTALYNASSSIHVIPVNLAEAMACRDLAGKAASFSITEEDMHVVLQAATELVGTHRDTILGALSRR